MKRGSPYPFVEMKAVDSLQRGVAESEIREFKNGGSRFMPYDTLMARITPCLENGKIAQYIPSFEFNGPAFGSTEFIIIRGREGVTENSFAYYLSKWVDFRQFAISQMIGSTGRQRVPSNSLSLFFIPLPSLAEQKAIAHILSTLDDKIELNRQMNATLESMAQAMFKSWFVDFDPVIDNALAAGNPIPEPLKARAENRKRLGDQRKQLPQEVQQQFPDRFVVTEELGWIPEGWEVLPIDTLIEIIGGGTPKTSTEEYWGGTIPWFSVVDTPNQSDVFVINTEKYITQQGLDNSSAQLLPEGTTIISARGTVGKCALVAQSMAMNQSCYGIRGKGNVSDYFVYYTILLRVADLQQRGHGSVFNTITRDTFKTLKIPFYNADLTSQYDEHVSSLFSKILENCRQSASLFSLRDTLLPKLISGQLRLPDSMIDKFAEQANTPDAEQIISEAI